MLVGSLEYLVSSWTHLFQMSTRVGRCGDHIALGHFCDKPTLVSPIGVFYFRARKFSKK